MPETKILLSAGDIEIVNNYLYSKLSPNDYLLASEELTLLHNGIDNFTGGLEDDQLYYSFLLEQSLLVEKFSEEADFLEWVIPLWSKERGKSFCFDKAVDEFYRELELLTLWRILVRTMTRDKFQKSEISLMRRIIRRYGKMPVLWRYLCNLSGEDVTAAYTF